VYSGWIHLKVIRGFVESVLRYGLPVDFVTAFIEPVPKKEKQALASVIRGMAQIREDLRALRDEEDDDDDTDSLPFVCHRFPVSGSSSLL
jgi:V-type H+-transporting ATPase subunit C